MRKQDFIKELRLNLSFLPKEEIDDRISFYSELIDDKIEEGVKASLRQGSRRGTLWSSMGTR